MSAELKRPQRDLGIALFAGVGGVIAVYVGVNIACLRILGPAGLAETATPASAVMQSVFGARGAQLIAIGIAISTLGFLSQGMLTAPRVYYAMAEDGLFFRAVAKVHPVTRVPYVAIALQGAVAILIAVSGRYEQILGYVVATDFIFFGLTGGALLIFRRRNQSHRQPYATIVFTAACWAVVVGTAIASPRQSAIGYAILIAGCGAYFLWIRRRR